MRKVTLVECLKNDIDRHRSGKFDEIGAEYDLYTNLPGGGGPGLAFDFWDSWVDEKNHGFPKFYDEIEFADWPVLAQSVVEDLENGKDATHPLIVKVFGRK